MAAMKTVRASNDLRQTRHRLDADTRAASVQLLNQRLADALDLQSQIKHAHWNVRGPGFHALHLLFDRLAHDMRERADDLAERATALGGAAKGTARQVAKGTSVEEFPAHPKGERGFVEALADRFGRFGASLAEGAEAAEENGDLGTSDLLVGMARDVDEGLYLLESHLSTER